LKTKIIAHRGASKYAPENTMPAFVLAYRMGAHGIETDVQLTKDDVPVLIHDENVKRTTDGYGYIRDFTYRDLKNLDAGGWFSNEYTGTNILTLDEFLKWAENKPLYLNIELKNNKIDYRHLENYVYERVDYYRLLNRTTISTFNPKSIKRLKQYNHRVGVALLISKRTENIISIVKELGGSALHIKYNVLHKRLVEESRKNNVPLSVFTVNKKMRMIRCLTYQVSGIFTDIPDKALAVQNHLQ